MANGPEELSAEQLEAEQQALEVATEIRDSSKQEISETVRKEGEALRDGDWDAMDKHSKRWKKAADDLAKANERIKNINERRSRGGGGKKDDGGSEKEKHHAEFQGSIQHFSVPLQPRASSCGTRASRGI